ncbi:hypothetical protein [Lederbergia galactosidilytica]|uniref:Uncharacterized protein n=1 Tax=Lederbergia galactosidilytica TaxID=217031 RepID=A0A0Q9XYP1_9BACI|nr:hypothetical protein [Lederbergia galactosidilytica]KRG11144.1 hypothetical protein ACA30_21175 [Virgibacillus soli]KRG13791.1 hypothetical protein ACA29_07510 [Lederbergia galactosidilytica]MBP1917499.1 hypothetical protein [Lederbergia galactosidilytica]OAK75046.1 hypothetical protein ABB05_03230 [Lederbergia galactosidilytica]
MNKQHDEMSFKEIRLYLLGIAVIISLFLLSVIFGYITTPLRILQFRLTMLAIGAVYYVSVYLYFTRFSKSSSSAIQDRMNDVIIILLNGKEYRR